MIDFHPKCLILIETQSELSDRQRTLVHRGFFGYKHWLHFGRNPWPRPVSQNRRHSHNCRQHMSGFFSFFIFLFYWPHVIHTLENSPSMPFIRSGWMHSDGFTAQTISCSNSIVGKCNSVIFPWCLCYWQNESSSTFKPFNPKKYK